MGKHLWCTPAPHKLKIHPFGCLVFANLPETLQRKWGQRTVKAIHLRRAEKGQDGYRLLSLDSGKIFRSRIWTAHHHVFPWKKTNKGQQPYGFVPVSHVDRAPNKNSAELAMENPNPAAELAVENLNPV